MNSADMVSTLDHLFATGQIEQIEAYLKEQYEIAMHDGNADAVMWVLNELVGFYRDRTMHGQAKETIEQIRHAITYFHMEGTVSEATSLNNIANALRFLGEYEQSLTVYNQVKLLYADLLAPDDMRIASLYNNMSLLFQATKEYDKARESLKSALAIVTLHPEAKSELAVTYTNLGQVYIQLDEFTTAKNMLETAVEIFQELGEKEFHYNGCLNALGALHARQGRYEEALPYYEAALVHIYDTIGMTENYQSIYENYMQAYRKTGRKSYASVMELCKAYYETYGAPMIQNEFTAYQNKIAVGLFGEGSECFGFDDEISLDHDCGPAFCMFVTRETYKEIGEALTKAYESLPRIFAGRMRQEMRYAKGRVGVVIIEEFFQRLTGGIGIPETLEQWRNVPEYGLACLVNGDVFADPEGIVSKNRSKLMQYYPEQIWREKLAKCLMECAQTGQYNYARMMARKQGVTAQIVLAEYMKQIMQCIYLMNRTYAPYYKWIHEGMKQLPILPEVAYLLEALHDMPNQNEAWEEYDYHREVNPNDTIAMTIEIIATLVTDKLRELGLSKSTNPYLEVQAEEIIKGMEKEEIMELETTEQDMLSRDEMIELIVKQEWEAFDQVQNEGGRASCQDNWTTFSIMRKSQYLTWTDEMLAVYLWYFGQCRKEGRNLITEKYGLMMESTSPEEYERIKDALPQISEERKKIQEQIIAIQVEWMEEFAAQYPNMSMNARSIHTSEDTAYNTSYETYLRGELGTYSEQLLLLYGQFVARLAKEQKNLAYETMNNTAKLYGYADVDTAEQRLSAMK